MNNILNDYQIVDNFIEEEKIKEAYRHFISIPNDSFNDESLNQLYRFKISALGTKPISSVLLNYYFSYFKNALDSSPLILERFYSVAGDYFFGKNQFGQAINQYQKCLEYNSINTHAILGQAKSYQILGIYDKSEEKYVQITHLYDWNGPISEDSQQSDNYSTLDGFLKNTHLEHVPNKILIDIGVFYTSIDMKKAKRIFKLIESNSKKSNNKVSSYFFVDSNPSDTEIKYGAESKDIEISKKSLLIDKISEYFPDFYNKFKHEINLGNYRRTDELLVDIEKENDSTQKFEIKCKTIYKDLKIYSVVPEQIEIDEHITSIFYLHLIEPTNYPLEKFFDSIKFEIINQGDLTKNEILKFWLKDIRDKNSLFLLKKYGSKKGKTSIPSLVKSHQAIKEINQKRYDVQDILKSLKNNAHSLDIFLDSLYDYFTLVHKEKSLPLDDFNFQTIIPEVTEYLERLKEKRVEKMQSKKAFLEKGYRTNNKKNRRDPMDKLKKIDETLMKLKKLSVN
jgi:tetratricopeptide (TPR) repeat protein